MAPKDENELQHMLRTAVEYDGPAAIRYPRGAGFGVPMDPDIKAVHVGEAELLSDGEDVAIVAFGTLVHDAMEAAAELGAAGVSASVLNARFAKPLDEERILAQARKARAVVTVEEGSGMGGFGSAVLELLARGDVERPTRTLAFPDSLVEHGDPAEQRARVGLDAAGIASAARELLGRS